MINTSHISPDVYIVGAQKAGTTTLQSLLKKHPDIAPPDVKEVAFFDRDPEYSKGTDYYLEQFPRKWPLSKKVTLDATPIYLYTPTCAERIHAFCPDARIIILLRDPVERAYSAWNMYRRMIEEGKRIETLKDRAEGSNSDVRDFWLERIERRKWMTFDECIDVETRPEASGTILPDCIRRGLYAQQLERYRAVFKDHQIKLFRFSEIVSDSLSVVKQTADFLGLRPFNWSRIKIKQSNVGEYKQMITDSQRSVLDAFYEESNRKIFEHTGWSSY